MSRTLSHRMILSSLCQYLLGVLPAGVPVSWSGMRIDTEDVSQWVEVWLTRQARVRQRKGATDQRQANISMRLFQKPDGNMLSHLRLEKKIVPILEHCEIDVRDYSSVGEPKVGQMRLLEVQPVDMTRSLNEQGFTGNRQREMNQLLRSNVKAIQLTCKALVQAT